MTQQDRMDAYYQQTIDIIMTHGWMVQGVFMPVGEPGVGFLYTVGLSWKGLPEFITFGLGANAGTSILNSLAKRAVEGEEMKHGTVVVGLVANGYAGVLLDVKDDSEYPLSMAHQMLRVHNLSRGGVGDGSVKASALQLVFQDRNYLWPEEPGYADTQLPILGELPTHHEGELT